MAARRCAALPDILTCAMMEAVALWTLEIILLLAILYVYDVAKIRFDRNYPSIGIEGQTVDRITDTAEVVGRFPSLYR